MTEISKERIAEHQPPLETINLESFLYYPPLIKTPFAETVRFSDFLRKGGQPVRYYHLVEYPKGIALALSPSGYGRIMSGTYVNRQIVCSQRSIGLADISSYELSQRYKLLQRFSCVWLDLEDNFRIISNVNCVEYYKDEHVDIHASLRLPAVLFHGDPRYQEFMQNVAAHLSRSDAFFSSYSSETIDAFLIIRLNFTLDYPLVHATLFCPRMTENPLSVRELLFVD